MRFREFKPLSLREFVQPQTSQSPADDLAYLIANTDLSPSVLKMISSTLKKIVSEPNLTTSPTQFIPQQQPAMPQQQPVAPQNTNQEEEPEDQLKEGSTEEWEAELLATLAQAKQEGKHDKLLSQLLYPLRDEQFKKMASEIVKNKFKDKNKESYELIKGKVRSLATRIPIDIMTDFLNDCLKGGVIDTIGMINGDTESTRIPLLDPRYERVAKEFLDLNLERLGRAEIGLAFMGVEAVKERSDLSIAGMHIEVKASKGTDFFMKGNPDEGGFGNQAKAVAILANALNQVGGEFKPHNKSKQGGIAAVGRTNINDFNNYFLKLGKERTEKVLVAVLKQFNRKMPSIIDQYSEELEAAVNEDGSINYPALSLVTAKINFDYYKTMSNHDGILVLNLNSFQFLYISDPETWASYVETNVLQQMYALDFRSNGLGGIAYIMNPIQGE